MAEQKYTTDHLTEERLKEAESILAGIADACNQCYTGESSWSQACQKHDLDPLKARRVILSLYKCTGKAEPLSEFLEDIYDGYEKFYRDVFCVDAKTRQIALPYDYKETVLYVLKNRDLTTEKESVALMRKYGIGDYEFPETLSDIGKDFNVSRSRISQIFRKALRKCRHHSRAVILEKGLERYNLDEKYKKDLHEQDLKAAEEEWKKEIEKEKGVEKRKLHPYIDDVINIDDVIKQLSDTSIDELELSTRSYRILIRGIERVFNPDLSIMDLLKYSKEDFMKIRNAGVVSVNEIVEKLDKYMISRFSMNTSDLQSYLNLIQTDVNSRL